MPIQYLIGDATKPVGNGNKIIAHCCNDLGGWGAGFVMALSRRWKEPEIQYRNWARGEFSLIPFELGSTQVVCVDDSLWVGNIIGQHGTHEKDGVPPIRYEALEKGLRSLGSFAEQRVASVHLPRLGGDLAGGKWYLIEDIIHKTLSERGLCVYVYDLTMSDRQRFESGRHIRPLV